MTSLFCFVLFDYDKFIKISADLTNSDEPDFGCGQWPVNMDIKNDPSSGPISGPGSGFGAIR